MRIKGWMGRADQTTKVKGMFVRPEQIAQIAARHPQIVKARLTVDRVGDQDDMVLAIEVETPSPELAAEVAETLRDVLKLRGEVEADVVGSLPNDGKVIDDIRKFD
jgi:phenylacetate-CoA ligase